MTKSKAAPRQVVLVTGASRGIGQAIAAELARAGYLVVGIARDIAALNKQAATLGRDAFVPMAANLVDPTELLAAIESVQHEFGSPAVLINNAGYGGPRTLIHETDDAHWRAVIDLNVNVPFMLARACIPGMIRGGFGRIINIGSVYSALVGVGSGAYATAKHALLGLTRSIAAEYGGRGLTCNLISPGFCDTRMVDDGLRAIVTKLVPSRRLVSPGEIASAVIWLVGPNGSSTNGANIVIDGGLSASIDLVDLPASATRSRRKHGKP